MNSPRQLSSYELNQLLRHGHDPQALDLTDERPVEYITGHVDFAGMDLLVNPAVLIPRVESEELVDLITHWITHPTQLTTSPSSPWTIADIGTGSGALGIGVAHSLEMLTQEKLIPAQPQGWQPYFSDLSPAALDVARANATRLLANLNNCTFLVSDLLSSYPAPFQAQVIIANLPYIPHQRLTELPAAVIDFEPRLALDGGDQGLTIIRSLLTQLPTYLAPGGAAFLEIDETHTADHLQASLPPHGWTVTLTTDQFGKTRFARIERTATT